MKLRTSGGLDELVTWIEWPTFHMNNGQPTRNRLGSMDLPSKKKTGLPIGKDRKKSDVVESSIVPSLQYPKGIHGK